MTRRTKMTAAGRVICFFQGRSRILGERGRPLMYEWQCQVLPTAEAESPGAVSSCRAMGTPRQWLQLL